ncbi:MAG: hypothetical protein AB1689_26525, partial [Thermodesulfobacteriota bacterium]
MDATVMKTGAHVGSPRRARTASAARAKKTGGGKTSAEARLATYRAKRRFEKTPEPAGGTARARTRRA